MHKLFRKKPALWYVLRPGRPGQEYAKEGPYERATIAQMQLAGQLGGGALLWTNERVFANAKKPNSARFVKCDRWLRWDELPDPTQNCILASANDAVSSAPQAGAYYHDGAAEPEPVAPPPPPPPGGYGRPAAQPGAPVQLVAEYPRPINEAAPPGAPAAAPAPAPAPTYSGTAPVGYPSASTDAPPGYPGSGGPAYGGQPSHPAYPQPR